MEASPFAPAGIELDRIFGHLVCEEYLELRDAHHHCVVPHPNFDTSAKNMST